VNTGAFDPVGAVCERAREAGAWVHVDGAFGLWAAANANYKHLTDGVERADSWALDAHKWLNVPYDSGLVVCRHGSAVKAGMASPAAYLVESDAREPYHFTPELSRRARGIEVWAAMRSLGRSGVAEMIERCCTCARRFADRLSGAGFEILNEVVINQVMVSFGAPEVTRRVIEGLQREGTCWCGGTRWQGREAMRISVSNWKTTEEDVDRCVAVMVREARGHGGR
jgi:glutamate/tyrosine decarboxylase-like PLP-dependent enzyme